MRTAIGSLGWVGTWFWPVLYFPHELGTCTMGSDDAWITGLFILPFVLLMLAAAALGIGQHRSLRWLTLPHAFTVILAIAWVTPYLWGTAILGKHLCAVRDGGFEGYEHTAFQPYWAPLQFAALVLLLFVVTRTWRSACFRGNTHQGSAKSLRGGIFPRL